MQELARDIRWYPGSSLMGNWGEYNVYIYIYMGRVNLRLLYPVAALIWRDAKWCQKDPGKQENNRKQPDQRLRHCWNSKLEWDRQTWKSCKCLWGKVAWLKRKLNNFTAPAEQTSISALVSRDHSQMFFHRSEQPTSAVVGVEHMAYACPGRAGDLHS